MTQRLLSGDEIQGSHGCCRWGGLSRGGWVRLLADPAGASQGAAVAVAIAHRDTKTICTEVFAPSLVKRFVSAGLSCERGLHIFFSGVRHPTLAVGGVRVHGSKASAMTLSGASGQTASLRPVELVRTSAGWRIAALGAPANEGQTAMKP